MRILVWLIALLWGIGQNLPFEQFYIHGISPGDFLFLGLLVALFANARSRAELVAEWERLWGLFLLIAIFVTLTAMSSAVNIVTWDLYGNDIIEMLRPFYYFLLIVFVSVNTRRYGVSMIVAFLAGVLISGIVAYLVPSNEDMLGLIVLWNPNVIGNMLAFGILLTSLLILEGRLIIASLFLLTFMFLSVFTFSKGTWLMTLLSFIACLIAFGASSGGRAKYLDKLILTSGVAGLFILAGIYFDALYELVSFKLATTQIGDSAAEGGTAAARWGFVKASAQFAMENPVFGIGISNYESAYNTMEQSLGNAFWPTDNPHSAWLYILACIGIPALFVFLGIGIYVLTQFNNRVPLYAPSRQIYLGLFAIVFFLSGTVLLHLLTQYFFWFFAGIASGWQSRRPDEIGKLV